MTTRTAIAVTAGILAAALPLGRAAAEPATLVFRVDAAGLPADAPDALTEALMRAARAEGLSPRLADASLREAAELLACDPATSPCLESLSETMEGSGLLAASVQPAGERLAVRLTYFRRGQPPVSREVEVASGLDAAATALEAEARATLKSGAGESAQPAAPPVATSGGDAAAVDRPELTSAPVAGSPGRSFSLRRVQPYAWAVAGAGVVLLGAGAFFSVKASGLRDDVEDAPRDTVADFEALEELEADGERATSLSTGFVIAGAVALAAGGGLIVWQGLSRPEERPATIAVTPAPLDGGAGLFVQVEVP